MNRVYIHFKPGVHYQFFFSFNPVGWTKKKLKSLGGDLVLTIWCKYSDLPTKLLGYDRGAAPRQNTQVSSFSHWLRVLIVCQLADLFNPFQSFSISRPFQSCHECRTVSIELASTAQYSAHVYGPLLWVLMDINIWCSVYLYQSINLALRMPYTLLILYPWYINSIKTAKLKHKGIHIKYSQMIGNGLHL